jgi:uncharacterized membrane protein YfcA
MPIWDIIVRLFFGTVIGFIIGMTSIGAGALVLPTLTVLLGMPATIAIGTASLYSFLIKIFASYRHFRLKTVDFRVSAQFLVGAVPADAAVSWWISGHAVELRGQEEAMHAFQGRMTVIIALVVLFCAIALMLQGRKRNATQSTAAHDSKISRPALRIGSIAVAGAFVGAVMGATGIGGGVLVVPILIMVVGLPPARTVGTSIFIALFLSLLTAILYGKSGETDIMTSIIMTIGGWVGVFFGGHLTTRIPDRALKLTITSIVMLAAVIMLAKAFI